ncbi:MAG: hypothetical protein A2857_00415 [Candidatus Levybacteria bacterium RIFCSPHIGHO2_01_FULL_36_15]|nr:MAG: hypothetical protein A2857_00415 [Candidatus Levybacteria bacterium RIFCSPHIGHO2_01_FULL_36_15]OGH38836.1 MAG: hypothetical protein A2905_02995 [Candidatus Levybacteria bacterium RIFCSPLOWO2_01_FULL_36_10]
MKVALVYDRVNKWGGAERILLALHKIFRNAPLYTSLYSKKNTPWADVFDIKTSFLQNIPKFHTYHELLAPVMPFAFESISFDNYDIVISVTSEAAKGIITKPHTLHICICLTPTRYLWSGYEEYFKNKAFRTFFKPVVKGLRTWDKTAAFRPDYIVAISKNVQERIKKYYGRQSTIIYPPVTLDLTKFDSGKEIKTLKKPFFLIVSRLVPYKRIDVAVKAFNKLPYILKIIGVGHDFNRLSSLAACNIEFLGNLTDDKLSYYYRNARALIFPGTEDFGLAMVEAQLFGTPVIALRSGGACEIIIEGQTGEFFDSQEPEALIKVLEKFDKKIYNSKNCQENATRFSYRNFEKKFEVYLKDKIKEFFSKKV